LPDSGEVGPKRAGARLERVLGIAYDQLEA
jgi:hypothetical protein